MVNNAVRYALDMEYLKLPTALAVGDFIVFVHQQMMAERGLYLRYTFSGSVYFERMKEQELYSIDPAVIAARVERSGMRNIYSVKLV